MTLRFHRYDSSGDIPARLAFALSLTGIAIVLLAPLLPERVGGRETGERETIVEREGAEAAGASLGLTGAAAVPFLLRRGPWYKVAQRLSAASLAVGVLVTITTVGIFFFPSAGLMTLAATRHPPRDPFR